MVASRDRRRRAGLSLVELLTAATVMVLIAAALGSAALAVQRLADSANGIQETVQHARVVMETFRRTVNHAHANLNFPGVVIFSESIGGESLPDTAVIWSPESVAANPEGLPLFSELVVLCPHPRTPNELVLLTNRADTRQVPPLDDRGTWESELAAFKDANADQGVVLTSLLRTASVTGGSGGQRTRGLVRFFAEQRPSAVEFDELSAGNKTWNELAWPLDLFNSETGVARCRCNLEFQLRVPAADTGESLAFFDAGAVRFVVENPARTGGLSALASPSLSSGP